MNNEELDSQLSAMFDDELPEPECELLARRLARDEGLKARWGRYAAIGACIRTGGRGEAAVPGSEAGTRSSEAAIRSREAWRRSVWLHGGVAGRVSRAIAAEPPLLAGAGIGRSKGLGTSAMGRWWQPVAGGAVVAAGVAAAAILWLRAGSPDAPIAMQTPDRAAPRVVAQASRPAIPAAAASPVSDSGGTARNADSYVVPPASDSASFAPPMELANFVVAHSEYSAPLLRRSVLSALIADESDGSDAVSAPLAGSAADTASAGAAGNGTVAPAARRRAAAASRTPHANQAH